MTYVCLVGCPSVINTSRKNDQIALSDFDADPLVRFIANVEEASSLDDESNLVVIMHVFVVEHFEVSFIHISHRLRRDYEFVMVHIMRKISQACDLLWSEVVVGRFDMAQLHA